MTPEREGRLTRPDGETLAWRHVPGAGPTLVWLGGFRSDMTGTKAAALAEASAGAGRAFLRFDYFAHGQSSGLWESATIGRWREDALAVIDQLTEGPLVMIGSSMGGWLACLAALARPERVKALVLIAPATDFTEALMRPNLPPEAIRAIERDGAWTANHGGESYAVTRRLLDEGRDWLILGDRVDIGVPVRILQGGLDDAAPWTHTLKLVEALSSPDVVFTLIKDGDHRLSRPQDLARLTQAVEEFAV